MTKLFICIVLSVGLYGCGSVKPTPENSAWMGVAAAFSGAGTDPTANASLSPSSWYLKIQAPDSPPALLAFGYLETQSLPPTEVWYSGSGQVVKIRGGRVVATHGLPGINWLSVDSEPSLIPWPKASEPDIFYQRLRSIQASYDYGIRERIKISATVPPTTRISSLVPGAVDGKAQNWRWYSESIVSSTRAFLPNAVYATAQIKGSTAVAYSMQCLSDTFCLHIMRWPQLESEPQP